MFNSVKKSAMKFIRNKGFSLVQDTLSDPKKVEAIKSTLNKGLDNTKITSKVGLSKKHTDTIKGLINKGLK